MPGFTDLKRISIAIALVFCACLGASAQDGGGLKIAFVVDGKVGGDDIAATENKMAAARLEGFLDKSLKEAFGIENFDQQALAKAKEDKEAWAVVTGGNLESVQKILKDSKLDILVRAYFRTAPAYKTTDADGNDIFAATATVMVEVISIGSGEKGAFVWSPPMGALETGASEVKHKAQKGADAFAAGMAALDYAAAQVVEKLKADENALVLFGKAKKKEEQADPLHVIFLIEGRIRGSDVSQTEQRVGAMRLEATLSEKLREAIGIKNFDESILEKAKQDKEQYAVLVGGEVEDVQKILESMKIDAAVRVFFRTAPAYRKRDDIGNSIYSGTASMTAQIILNRSGEKGEVILSPTMGTAEHPARRALDSFDAGMSALDYASDKMLEQLMVSPSLKKLKSRTETPGESDAGSKTGKKALFVMTGSMTGEDINPVEQRVGAMTLETMLDRKLRAVLGLKNFDEQTLAKVRGNAEEWAVLLGEDVEAVQKVLANHNVDSIIKVDYSTAPTFFKKDKDGNAIYSATAKVKAVVVGRKSRQKEVELSSPEMGTDKHKAKAALDSYDAGMAALDYATDRMVEQFEVNRGAISLMDGKPATAQPAVENKDATPSKPTVAVLWIKPEFSYWSIPRSSQPGLNRKKRAKMKAFVDHVKSTGSIGAEVAHFLVQGIVASGALLPLESSEKNQEDMASIQNKLLEYRMAGWIEEKLPFSDPVEATRQLKADYVVTAKITKIYENTTSKSALFASSGSQTGFAEVELVITSAASGKSKIYKSKGSFSKTGYGTFMSFTPENMAMDKMMIGGAIKEALYNAATQIKID
ncbi:MAG: hypothetical protein JXR97_02015 [Planctomycetes bacterium]|nr:hypothetical protein [Planctomycetota bacterium]